MSPGGHPAATANSSSAPAGGATPATGPCRVPLPRAPPQPFYGSCWYKAASAGKPEELLFFVAAPALLPGIAGRKSSWAPQHRGVKAANSRRGLKLKRKTMRPITESEFAGRSDVELPVLFQVVAEALALAAPGCARPAHHHRQPAKYAAGSAPCASGNAGCQGFAPRALSARASPPDRSPLPGVQVCREEMMIGRSDEPHTPPGSPASDAADLFGAGSRNPSGPAACAAQTGRTHDRTSYRRRLFARHLLHSGAVHT